MQPVRKHQYREERAQQERQSAVLLQRLPRPPCFGAKAQALFGSENAFFFQIRGLSSHRAQMVYHRIQP